MNIDLELLKAEIRIAEQEIYEHESEEFIRGYDFYREMVDKYLKLRRKSWEADERNRILKEMGFNGGD